MRIAAYCRVSTDKEDQINSLEAQKEYFSNYAVKRDYTLVDIYPDEGLSGTSTTKRAEFNRMLADAKHGKIDLIVTKEVSRFARNTVDTLSITRMLKGIGIGVLFLSDNINTLDNDGELRLSIMASIAQEESRKVSERVKWGKKQTAKKGRVPNIIFGYDKIEGNNFDLLINEKEADIIRRIYDMYIKEGHGATKISNILNDEGIKTKRGYVWSQNAICRILTNPFYTGKITNGKQETKDFLTRERVNIIEDSWIISFKPELRIIEDETFEKAQDIMNGRRKDFICFRKRQSNSHLFSTLIKCTDCGYSYSRRFAKTAISKYKWHCTSRTARGHDFCSNHFILEEDELINFINRYFASLITDKRAMINNLVSNFKKQYNKQGQSGESEKSLSNKLKQLEIKYERYTEMYADGILSKEQLIKKTTALKKERFPIEQALLELRNKITKAETLDDVLRKTFTDLERITDIKNLSNEQLKEIIDRIEVSKDGQIDIFMKTFKDIGLEGFDEKLQISDIYMYRTFTNPENLCGISHSRVITDDVLSQTYTSFLLRPKVGSCSNFSCHNIAPPPSVFKPA